MDVNEIRTILYGVMQKMIPQEERLKKLWQNGRSLPLTGEQWGFDGIHLTYLFLEVENVFQIKISPKFVTNYQFNTIDSIVNIVAHYLPVTNRKEAAK